MGDFEKNLNRALAICGGYFRHVSKYSRIYAFTTENIDGYMKCFDLKDKSLLTVGSSGDQVLNAFFYGAKDITLYDINPYAKYYTYLKSAGILSLDYTEFQDFFFKHTTTPYKYNPKMFSKKLFDKIKPNLRLLDYESFLFFNRLFDSQDSKTIRAYLFDDEEDRSKIIKSVNVYLKDEESYNKMQSVIRNISFNYMNGDIFKDNIPGQFDNIVLSNLCTITSLNNFKKLLQRMDSNNISANGSIMFGYLWDSDFNSTIYYNDWKEIYKLPLAKELLKEFVTEHYQINGPRDYLCDENEQRDLILIYRKRQ